MADQDKLRKLFDAALKAPTPSVEGPPQRAFPKTMEAHPPAPVVMSAPAQAQPASAEEKVAPKEASNCGALDDAISTELGGLLDEQVSRKRRKRHALVAVLVLFGMIGGGFGWFVQSPERVDAVGSAMWETRSSSDVKSFVARYQAALVRSSAGSQKTDQSTAAMDTIVGLEGEVDPNLIRK